MEARHLVHGAEPSEPQTGHDAGSSIRPRMPPPCDSALTLSRQNLFWWRNLTFRRAIPPLEQRGGR
jgi:hypothetical protein